MSYNTSSYLVVAARISLLVIFFLSGLTGPPFLFSSDLTCTAQVKSGLHQIKVEAVFLHLEPGTDHIWISTKAQLANGPVMVSATAQGFPVAYHIFIDGAETAYCGADPREVFSDGFESGGTETWSYSGPLQQEVTNGDYSTD